MEHDVTDRDRPERGNTRELHAACQHTVVGPQRPILERSTSASPQREVPPPPDESELPRTVPFSGDTRVSTRERKERQKPLSNRMQQTNKNVSGAATGRNLRKSVGRELLPPEARFHLPEKDDRQTLSRPSVTKHTHLCASLNQTTRTAPVLVSYSRGKRIYSWLR